MDDIFLPLPNLPGYRVNGLGEVQSCWSRHARPPRMTDAWRPLAQFSRDGYPSVNLSKGGKKTARKVHRLVLETFVGPCPEGMIACHGDGDRANCDLTNLRWDTPRANSEDTLLHGRRSRGENSNSKLKEAEVVQIRRLRAEGVPSHELAARFGVAPRHVESIVNRRCWRHLPNEQGGDPKLRALPARLQERRGDARC